MLYLGFYILPRSVSWSANLNGRSDNTDVIQLMTNSENPYSPPKGSETAPIPERRSLNLRDILLAPINFVLIVFLFGVPIFVVISLAWMLIVNEKLIHFNFFVFPEYNPVFAASVAGAVLFLIFVYYLRTNTLRKH